VRQQTDPGAKPQPIEPRATPQRPAISSRAFLERGATDEEDDDDRPTGRPPPVAELAKGMFDVGKPQFERANLEPVSTEPEFISVAPDPISVAPDAMHDEAEPGDGSPKDDDELPTLPPTGSDSDDDGDDEPTIVEPYSFFAARNLSIEDRASDERPTDRAIPAATPVAADPRTAPPPVSAHREDQPGRAAAPPPAPRVGTARDQGLSPIGYPGAPTAAARVMSVDAPVAPAAVPTPGPGSSSAKGMSHQHGLAASLMSRAAPSVPPVAPALSGQVFRSVRAPSQRSKSTNIAAAVGALVIIAAAGYLGAMSGKRIEATPAAAPAAPSAIAKVEAPAPPDPPAAPPPVVEAPAPPPLRAAAPEPPPPPPPREVVRESPPPRRTTTDEETPRPRESTRTKSRTPRPPADEEGAGNGPPETRLPDSSEAPAARATVDQGALRAAFAEGEAKAKSCLGSTSPTGVARISVTFAPTGEAVGAVVSGSPFANTLEGQCMAAKFRTLHVPPFVGAEVIVRKSISFL